MVKNAQIVNTRGNPLIPLNRDYIRRGSAVCIRHGANYIISLGKAVGPVYGWAVFDDIGVCLCEFRKASGWDIGYQRWVPTRVASAEETNYFLLFC
jgi:hypothetical protein